jgi:carboxymethylenebutenolidase
MTKFTLLSAAALLVATAAPAQDWAKARIEKSPRHGEWVKIKQGNREVESFITYPEVKDKATAVVVIHEIFGLSDWARGMTDELAEAGYIAIAPDLLSGMAPNGGGTAELGSGVGKAIQALPPDQITADLDAVVDYVSKLPSCNGKVVVMGFCWGGGQTFRFATNNKNIKAALPFYGTGPTSEDAIARITCPVYGFYAENDARVTSTVAKSTDLMKAAGKTYQPVTYSGAGHGFMRAGEDPNSDRTGDKKAREEAWKRIKEILKKV